MLTVVVSPWFDVGPAIPKVAELRSSSGAVTYLAKERKSIKFRLSTSAKTFDYASKVGASDLVMQALSTSQARTVTVLYGPQPISALLQAEDFYVVWGIFADGQPVRSISDSIASWRSDDALRPWLSGFFGVCTAYLAVVLARSSRPNAK